LHVLPSDSAVSVELLLLTWLTCHAAGLSRGGGSLLSGIYYSQCPLVTSRPQRQGRSSRGETRLLHVRCWAWRLIFVPQATRSAMWEPLHDACSLIFPRAHSLFKMYQSGLSHSQHAATLDQPRRNVEISRLAGPHTEHRLDDHSTLISPTQRPVLHLP